MTRAIVHDRPAQTGQRRRRTRRSLTRPLLVLATLALSAIYLLPLAWLLSVSVRAQADVFQSMLLPRSIELSNYPVAWERYDLALLGLNSAIVTIGTVVLGVGLSVTAAYGFARYRTALSEALYIMILVGLMVPPAAIIIPFFLGMLQLGLYDTLVAVIFGETAFVLAFGILIFRGYIEHIPRELIDAARVDGASEWASFRHIVLPLLRPPLATVAIFFTMSTWNGFLLPLVLIRDTGESTLTVGLSRYTGQFGLQDWNLLAAAAVIAIAPLLVVFILARRSYVQGISAGALKQ